MSTSPRTLIIHTALIIALSSSSLWSQAGDLDRVQSKTVSYAGLDLNNPKEALILYSRLKAAAYSACGASESVNPSARTVYNPCIKMAVGDAVQSLNRTQLTRLYMATYHVAPERNEVATSVASVR